MKNEAKNGKLRRVLVAVDFSDDARAALTWACRYASAVAARLVILHVVHDPAEEPGYYRAEARRRLRPMEEAAAVMLDEFVDALRSVDGCREPLEHAEKHLLRGIPPSRIVAFAALQKAELIVIGSRGLSGLPHLLQGSVSERVVEMATGPVVVVKVRGKHQREEEKKRKQELKKALKERTRKLKKEGREDAGKPASDSEPGQPKRADD